MIFVIPMAGTSKRFTDAGFKKPKFMLEAKKNSLFFHSLKSFKKFFNTAHFLFICSKEHNSVRFIDRENVKLGISSYTIIELDKPTNGQAQTVYLGLKEAEIQENSSIFIFNIDTFRPNFSLPNEFKVDEIDGYLETFIGSGPNWSNVIPRDESNQTVIETAEKKEISNLCCTGLYYWNKVADYFFAFNELSKIDIAKLDGSEYYIAPMYNLLIKQKKDIRYTIIDREEVIFCGVPDEYYDFCNS